MDRILEFLQEIYEYSPTDRMLVKTIYEDFGTWITAKYGIQEWIGYENRQFHKYLQSIPIYTYKRYREGICIKGIKYRGPYPHEDLNLPYLESVMHNALEAGPVQRFTLKVVGYPNRHRGARPPQPATSILSAGANSFSNETPSESASLLQEITPAASTGTLVVTSASSKPNSSPVAVDGNTSSSAPPDLAPSSAPEATSNPVTSGPPVSHRGTKFVPKRPDRRHRPAPKSSSTGPYLHVAGLGEIPDLDTFIRPFNYPKPETPKEASTPAPMVPPTIIVDQGDPSSQWPPPLRYPQGSRCNNSPSQKPPPLRYPQLPRANKPTLKDPWK